MDADSLTDLRHLVRTEIERLVVASMRRQVERRPVVAGCSRMGPGDLSPPVSLRVYVQIPLSFGPPPGELCSLEVEAEYGTTVLRQTYCGELEKNERLIKSRVAIYQCEVC